VTREGDHEQTSNAYAQQDRDGRKPPFRQSGHRVDAPGAGSSMTAMQDRTEGDTDFYRCLRCVTICFDATNARSQCRRWWVTNESAV
jgi:hypothetical protein